MRHSKAIAVVSGLIAAGLGALGFGLWHKRPSGGSAVTLAAAPPAGPAPTMDASPKVAVRPQEPAASRISQAPAPVVPKDPAPPPQFDIVRVEPTGDALVAGRGAPNATVALVERGKVVAEAKTDAGGNFVMTPPALQPGDYALSLRDGSGQGAPESKESVTVSVPRDKRQPVVVAKAEPGQPTQLLVPPPAAAPAAKASENAPAPSAAEPAKMSPFTIRSVELENGSGFYATGTARPGADVRLYLNDSRIADVTAGAVGGWSVTVRRGLAAGHYAVRADLIGNGSAVEARSEVPFDVPQPASPPPPPSSLSPTPAPERTVAAAPPMAPVPPAPTAPEAKPADVVVEALQTELVTRGDNLWRISQHRLGQGTRYTQIYAANAAQIRDPDKIYPGQVFVMPRN